MLMLIGIAISVVFAWRYADLSRTVERNKATMASHLQQGAESTEDASLRVARAVENDEQLFNDTLVAGSAKRTAGFIALFALTITIVALTLLGRSKRDTQSRR